MQFCLAFLVVLALSQVLRQFSLGLSPFLLMIIVNVTCIVLALMLLRRRTALIINRPSPFERYEVLDWGWMRTIGLVLVTALFLWGMQIGYGFVFGDLALRPISTGDLLYVLLIQVMLVGLSEELFFREAGLLGQARQPFFGLVVTSLAFFVFHLHLGFWDAIIALGAGLVYGSLRIAGAGILGVALLHGVTNVIFSRVVTLGLPEDGQPLYSLSFLCATCILSLVLFRSRDQSYI